MSAGTAACGEIGISPERRRGRGAGINPDGRFEHEGRTIEDDGWGSAADLPPLATEVRVERPKQVITRNESPDIGFARSINAYRGCEHGCVYCFARPTHAYLGLSPGLDFETRLTAKPDAPAALARELSNPRYRARPIALGTNTDPYQPIERTWRITRGLLEVLEERAHPVAIVTKSTLVLRDIDILGRMASRGLAAVTISVTTLDPTLARLMEPRAPTPPRRLEAIERLAAAGIPTSVLVAPVIPAINDAEIERILEAVAAAGARRAGYVLLRLPHEVTDIVQDWLVRHFPDRARKVMSLLRGMRGGKDYDARWGLRMSGDGPYASTIKRRFELASERLGLAREPVRLRTDLFVPTVEEPAQMRLL